MHPILLLHGAIGSSDQLRPLKNKLASDFQIIEFNFPGHGGGALPNEGFTIPLFAQSVLEFLKEQNLDKVHIVGYSMGGYVGAYLARHYPERVARLATLATKFFWDSATSAKEIKMLDAEKIREKLPHFAEALANRHAPTDWKQVLEYTASMLHGMGENNPLKPEDLKEIQNEVLLLLGDRDRMVTLEETVATYQSLPHGQMGILPATPHPVEQVNLDAWAFLVAQFLGKSI